MAGDRNQPREYDLILGGQAPAPTDGGDGQILVSGSGGNIKVWGVP